MFPHELFAESTIRGSGYGEVFVAVGFALVLMMSGLLRSCVVRELISVPGVSYGAVALAVSAGDSDVYSEMFVVRVMTKEYAINAAAVIQVDLQKFCERVRHAARTAYRCKCSICSSSFQQVEVKTEASSQSVMAL